VLGGVFWPPSSSSSSSSSSFFPPCYHMAVATCWVFLQDALIRSLLEMVCVYYRKQAGIEEEEPEGEVSTRGQGRWRGQLCMGAVSTC